MKWNNRRCQKGTNVIYDGSLVHYQLSLKDLTRKEMCIELMNNSHCMTNIYY